MNVKPFKSSCFALSINCFLFFPVDLCTAQQTHATQAPLLTVIKTFQQIEDRWNKAIGKRDQYAREPVLSPELTDISAAGDLTARNQQIAMLFQKGTEPLLLDQRVVSAQTFGDLAVVIGTYVEQLRGRGKPVQRKGMIIHIYHNMHGNWLCAGAQRRKREQRRERTMPGTLLPAPSKARSERLADQGERDHDFEYSHIGLCSMRLDCNWSRDHSLGRAAQ
jgi:hypothetical protein